MSAEDRLRADLFALLQPVVIGAIANHWSRVLGSGHPQDLPTVTEDDTELGADITHEVISALPQIEGWVGDELMRLQNLHGLWLDGPMRYPGGKDGMFQVVCSCGMWRSSPGSTPASATMWEAGRVHSRSARSRDLDIG